MTSKVQTQMDAETRKRYLTILLLFAIYRYYQKNHKTSDINVEISENAVMNDLEAALIYLKQNGRDGRRREESLLLLIAELSLNRKEKEHWIDKITQTSKESNSATTELIDYSYGVIVNLMKNYGIQNIQACYVIIHDAATLEYKTGDPGFVPLKVELTTLAQEVWTNACPFLPNMVSHDKPVI